MRYWIILCVSLMLPFTLSAQRGGRGGGGSRGGGGAGHGSVGGGIGRGGGTVGHAGGIGRGGGSVGFGGYNRGGWNRGGYGYGRGWYGRGYGLGFYGGYYGYYPGLYWSGYYPWGYDSYGYSAPSYDYGYAPMAADSYQPPTVVMNQAYRYQSEAPASPPPPREYADKPNDAVDYSPTLYLIALRDHNIRPALTYWVERGALHYVTMEHEMKEIPLASIDRDLSIRLNRERNMSFRLPAS